jgi:hypothetical protein
MEALLQERRIHIWEYLCQHYTIPKGQFKALDAAIRTGEELPHPKKTKPTKS